MPQRSVALLLPILAAVACKPNGSLETTDVRIDGAPTANDPESLDPQMCLTQDGTLHVVWVDDREGTSSVWLNTSSDGGLTWLTNPVKISHGMGNAFAPSLACVTGVLHVAWEDDRDGELENHNIYYNRSGDGGATWNEADTRLTLDEEGETISLGPQLTAAGNEVYVTWFDNDNGAFDIFAVASPDRGQNWGPPVRVDDDDAGSSYSAWPQVGSDGAGHVYLAWEDSRDGASDIYAASSNNLGASYWPNVRIDGGDVPGQSDSFSPSMDAENGTVYVAWHDSRNPAHRDIYMNWSLNHGQNWATDAIRVESDSAGFFDSMNPDVEVSGTDIHVAWQDARAIGYDAFVRTGAQGVFIDEEDRLDTDSAGSGNSLHPHVIRDGETVVVVWEDRRDDDDLDGFNDLYYNYSGDGGANWATSDLRLDSYPAGASYAVDVQLALRESTLYAVWRDGRGGTSDIYFQSLLVGEEATLITPEE